jgi:hypothetical protein
MSPTLSAVIPSTMRPSELSAGTCVTSRSGGGRCGRGGSLRSSGRSYRILRPRSVRARQNLDAGR